MIKLTLNNKPLILFDSTTKHQMSPIATQCQPTPQHEGTKAILTSKTPKNDINKAAKVLHNTLQVQSPLPKRTTSLANVSGGSFHRSPKKRDESKLAPNQTTNSTLNRDRFRIHSPYSRSPKQDSTSFNLRKTKPFGQGRATSPEVDFIVHEDVLREKEELEKGLKNEWLKYLAEKQNSEKISQNVSKLQTKLHLENLRRISGSPKVQEKKNFLDSFFPTTASKLDSIFQTQVLDFSPEKDPLEKKKESTTSIKNCYFFGDSPSMKKLPEQIALKASFQRAHSPTIDRTTELFSNDSKDKSQLQEKGKRNNSKKQLGAVLLPRRTEDNTMKTQAATRLSVTESSFTQDEINEFRRIRESLWAKEMKSAMAQKNDERMEKLMKMDIGRTLDGLTKALSKIKVRIESFFENTNLFAILIN